VARPKRTLTLVAALTAAVAFGASAPAHGGTHAAAFPSCHRGYYKNVSGHCVHRPVKVKKNAAAPAGATAKCRDGSYSFSEHASGTCSHHGGVAVWINHP
jgi:hypothetical protein